MERSAGESRPSLPVGRCVLNESVYYYLIRQNGQLFLSSDSTRLVSEFRVSQIVPENGGWRVSYIAGSRPTEGFLVSG